MKPFLFLQLLLLTTPLLAEESPLPEIIPATKLRAYGTLSGSKTTLPGQPQASILQLTADSIPKAQLLLAKYLSDLSLLPGVSPLPLTTAHGAIAARQIQGQGAIAALRTGAEVRIFTAGDAAVLQRLIDGSLPAAAQLDASEAEIPVPMYLDRWDKYGFRFYYGPFVKPEGARTYDPHQDFTFARDSGHAGLVVWNSPSIERGADGILDFNSREWVFEMAKKFHLPMGVNIGITDNLTPLVNRFPDQTAPTADQYIGGWYGAINWGGNTPAWSAEKVDNLALAQLQSLVRQLGQEDTIVNWLEPHEEMVHGLCDVLDDHGPAARENFHRYLRTKYGTPEAVATRWQQPGAFSKWEDVPFPELATFLGWNDTALDLTGTWKISYQAPYGAESAARELDDSAWASLQAPGHSIVRGLPHKPAVFRRHIAIDPAWRAAHPQVWLYVLDMNDTRQKPVLIFVNGHPIEEKHERREESHWAMLDITSAVTDGDNVIALCLPQAALVYRTYLSGEAPHTYPAMGPRLNAMWADFSDWTSWSRGEAVRRGAGMIRQIDPDRPITFMSPDGYMGPIKEVAEDYGGIFHDTGGMAGSWGDMHPVMVQSMGLPSDCEPGSGATDLPDFKRFMGRWLTEGTNGVDYFQHIGDIEWKPAVKEYFTKTLPMWELLGKYHVPPAELAVMNSDRNLRLTGFPWATNDVRPDLIQGNKFWGLISQLLPDYPRGGVLEQDFARGQADRFRVILDGNTTILDPEVIEQIEQWVRRGGIFITYQQTGRHTSVQQDAWPISKLTGYSVTGIDKLSPNGDGLPSRTLHEVPGQNVFHNDVPEWNYVIHGAGLSLAKVDPACQDLLQWDDGSIAAGLRPLGKGYVVALGTNTSVLPRQAIEWAKVKKVPIASSDRAILTRHFVSNNGLYDVWAMWNTKGQPITADFRFRKGAKPASCTEVETGAAVPILSDEQGSRLAGVAFEPWETRLFLSPREKLAEAPAEWLALQQGWWSGTKDPGAKLAPYEAKTTLNLTDDWAVKVIDGDLPKTPEEDATMADPTLDDSAWPRQRLGIFNFPEHAGARHAYFRKRITVPAEWNHGRVRIFTEIGTPEGGGFRRYVDGKLLGRVDHLADLDGIFTPGSTHLVTLDVWGDTPAGVITPFFLSYRPDPIESQPIAEGWAPAPDRMTYGPTESLPFRGPDNGSIRALVKIDPREAGRNVILSLKWDKEAMSGLIFNGHWIPGTTNIYNSVEVNVTPWVRLSQENEIIIIYGQLNLREVNLDYFEPEKYP